MGYSIKIPTTKELFKKAAFGAAVSLITSVGCAAICAAAISYDIIHQRDIGYCAVFIILISSMCAGLISAGSDRDKRMYIGMLASILYAVELLLITMLFFGGEYQGIPITVIVIVTGYVLSIMVSKKGMKQRKSMRRKKYRR